MKPGNGGPSARLDPASRLDADAEMFRIGADDEPVREGFRLGSYRVLGEIGRGGMGVVYLAERADGHYSQRVAVKLLRFAADADDLARFTRERQILARLQHPHIARLLDGGVTPDQAPYLVMELVEGEPLDAFCDARDLDLDARLELFDQVCEAVAYAHRHLVVHRDLKPSNVLVCGDAGVKLLDFGIAKILRPDDTDHLTADLGQLMTPRYASPEQMQGTEVTALSDVYQLGNTLYELVTGSRPFQVEGVAAHIRAVCFETPRPASQAVLEDPARDPAARPALARRIRGDLDAILAKSLCKEPELRYSSVEALRKDLDCHRLGLPISAHPDRFGYRLRKFVGRHRVATAVSGVLLLGLLAGLLGTTLGLLRAQRAEQQAREARVQAENLVSFLLDDLHNSLSSLGRTDLLERSAELSRDYFEELPAELRDGARGRIARAHVQVGALRLGRGETDAALESFEQARAALALDPAEPGVPPELALPLGDAHCWTGRAYRLRGELAEAEASIRRAVEILQAQPASSGRLAQCQLELGLLMEEKNDLPQALARYQDAEAIHRSLLEAEPGNDQLRGELADDLYRLAWLHHLQGREQQAFAGFDELIALLEDLVAGAPDDVEYRGALAQAYRKLATLQDRAGQTVSAADSVRRSQAMHEQLVARDTLSIDWIGGLASDCMELSLLLWKQGELDQAVAQLEHSLELNGRLLRQLPSNSKPHGARAWQYLVMAWMLRDAGRETDVRPWVQKAYGWSRDPDVPESSTSLGVWAAAAATSGWREEALQALRRLDQLGLKGPQDDSFARFAATRGVLRWPEPAVP